MRLKRGIRVKQAFGPPRLRVDLERAMCGYRPRLVVRWGMRRYQIGWWWTFTRRDLELWAPAIREAMRAMSFVMGAGGRDLIDHMGGDTDEN